MKTNLGTFKKYSNPVCVSSGDPLEILLGPPGTKGGAHTGSTLEEHTLRAHQMKTTRTTYSEE